MEKRYIKALIEKATDSGFSFIASTAAVDRQGDSVAQSGWELANYMLNPVMLWAHDYSAMPVARAIDISVDPTKGLVGKAEFAPAEGNPFAAQLKIMVEEGFVSALSVGFIPKERQGNVITRSELLEISFVPVPANQEALMLAAKSLKTHGFAEDVVSKFITAMKEGEEQTAEVVADAPVEEVVPAEEVAPAEVVAETTEEKGAVADEIAADEVIEQKWENMDALWEIMGAFCDVYMDENTPVEAFADLLKEVADLISQLADQGTGMDDDDQAKALRALIAKSFGIDAQKGIAMIESKIGSRSVAGKAVFAGSETTSSKDGEIATEDEPTPSEETTTGEEESEGMTEVRAMLITRGILREATAGDQGVLSILNRHLEARGQK